MTKPDGFRVEGRRRGRSLSLSQRGGRTDWDCWTDALGSPAVSQSGDQTALQGISNTVVEVLAVLVWIWVPLSGVAGSCSHITSHYFLYWLEERRDLTSPINWEKIEYLRTSCGRVTHACHQHCHALLTAASEMFMA